MSESHQVINEENPEGNDKTGNTDHVRSTDETINVVLALKGVSIIAAILLISSSVDISKVKACQLHTALSSIKMQYTPHPCKYNTIKEKSGSLLGLGIPQLIWNVVLLFSIFYTRLSQPEVKTIVLRILHIFVIVGTFGFFIGNCVMYFNIIEERETSPDIDYIRLQSKMISWLKSKYKSDNYSGDDETSSGWNIFFMKYDCCGVREVLGTTNDFDNTTWCTQSGSCQATSSQIPKTCCRSVSPDDYQNAPSNCHASVNPGTFKPGCISRMREMRVVDIDEFQISMICLSLLILAIIQIFEATMLIVPLCCNLTDKIGPEKTSNEDLRKK